MSTLVGTAQHMHSLTEHLLLRTSAYTTLSQKRMSTLPNGYTASMQVFNSSTSDMTLTKFRINATVTAVPVAEHSNSNYCSDNNLGVNLDDMASEFKQCLNITTEGANTYNGMVSNDRYSCNS